MYRGDCHSDANERTSIDFGKPQAQRQEGLIQRLRDASKRQERLASSREGLLIKREQLRASGKKVHAKRVEAGDAEAALMSGLRELYNGPEGLPASLSDVYQQVEAARNSLGVLEEDYLAAERTLGGDEWDFMEKENDFYELEIPEILKQLRPATTLKSPLASLPLPPLPPPPPPPPPLQSQLPLRLPFTLSSQHLREQELVSGSRQPLFLQPNKSQPAFEVKTSAGATVPSSSIRPRSGLQTEFRQNNMTELDGMGEQFVTCGMVPQSSTPGSDPDYVLIDLVPAVAAQRHSIHLSESQSGDQASQSAHGDPSRGPQTDHYNDIGPERARTESALSVLYHDPITKAKVRDWLLIYLKENPVQRALYRNILEGYGIQSPVDETWEERATYYWSVDSRSEGGRDDTTTAKTSCDVLEKLDPDLEPQASVKDSLDVLIGADIDFAKLQRERRPPEDEAFGQHLDDPSRVPLPLSSCERLDTSITADLTRPSVRKDSCTEPDEHQCMGDELDTYAHNNRESDLVESRRGLEASHCVSDDSTTGHANNSIGSKVIKPGVNLQHANGGASAVAAFSPMLGPVAGLGSPAVMWRTRGDAGPLQCTREMENLQCKYTDPLSDLPEDLDAQSRIFSRTSSPTSQVLMPKAPHAIDLRLRSEQDMDSIPSDLAAICPISIPPIAVYGPKEDDQTALEHDHLGGNPRSPVHLIQ